jgi:DNA modification methylase
VQGGRPERKATSTSNFGVSRRENHDASGFYERFVAPEVSSDDTVRPLDDVDRIHVHDARSMTQLPDASVALVVTSPPYFAGKAYEEALGQGAVPSSYADYLTMLEDVFAECVRVLEPGGRIAVNVANLGRKPFRSLTADVTTILQDRLRLLLRGEVVWVKARGASGNCAWGSFQRPTNPVLRDLTERVVIASKGRFDRAVPARRRAERGLPHDHSLTRDEFMDATTDLWEIAPESATRVGHPAPFPVELPERLIHLYTYRGDVVLDPFMGSGSTAVAAVRTGRHYVGFDLDATYVAAAEERIRAERARIAVGGDPTNDDTDGPAAREHASTCLAAAGFTDIGRGPSLPGQIEIDLTARDRAGRTWLFDVCGGFTAVRPGLARPDTFWKSLGRAALVHAARPDVPYVLLTTALPGGTGRATLAAVVGDGPNHSVRDVIVMTEPDDLARLASHAAGD